MTISRPEEVLLKEVENLALALEGKSLGYTFGLKVEFDLEDPVFFPPYSDSFIILIKKSKIESYSKKLYQENYY